MSSQPLDPLRSGQPLTGDGPLVAWCGDDFTGASATLEVLVLAGVKAVLFLEVPTAARLTRFPDVRAVGVATTARAMAPARMRRELTEVLGRLAELDPVLIHYKICTTLDSAPDIGSIGCAIEVGSDLTGGRVVPVVVAAPCMRRYQVFGQLFAAHGEEIFRLDRHPVMARHPVTPMTEADVATHLARQSDRIAASAWTMERMGKPGAVALPDPPGDNAIAVVAIDSWDDTSETEAGRILWENRASCPFVVGSQGVEYALVRHWRATGLLSEPQAPSGIGRCDRMVSVSGSVSPTTADQIAWSRANGFACIAFDAAAACGDAAALAREEDRVVTAALAALAEGRDPLVHTAEGPDGPAVDRLRRALAAAGRDAAEINQAIGEALGRVLRAVVQRSGTRRAVISGGDTSGHATRQLGVYALSVLAPTIPGASIFEAHADGPMDGLELALKGGQMGSPDYFGWVRDGGGSR